MFRWKWLQPTNQWPLGLGSSLSSLSFPTSGNYWDQQVWTNCSNGEGEKKEWFEKWNCRWVFSDRDNQEVWGVPPWWSISALFCCTEGPPRVGYSLGPICYLIVQTLFCSLCLLVPSSSIIGAKFFSLLVEMCKKLWIPITINIKNFSVITIKKLV